MSTFDEKWATLLRTMLKYYDHPRLGSGVTMGFDSPRDRQRALGRLEDMGFRPQQVFATRIYVSWNKNARLFTEPAMERARTALKELEER